MRKKLIWKTTEEAIERWLGKSHKDAPRAPMTQEEFNALYVCQPQPQDCEQEKSK